MPELGCRVHGRHSKGDRLRNYDMSTPSHACLAVSPTRRIEEFLIANRPLAAHQRDVPGAADLSIDPAAWLATKDVADFLISEKSTLLDLYPGVSYAVGAITPYLGARIPLSTSYDNELLKEERDTVYVFQLTYRPLAMVD